MRVVNRNVRYGYNRLNTNNSSFTSVFYDRMRKALRRNLREYMFIAGMTSKKEYGPNETDQFYEQFEASQVRLDIHFVNPVRKNEGQKFEIVPRTFQDGKRVIRNGMSTDPRNHRGLNSNGTTAMVVFVEPYMDGLHIGHAIGAFKLNDILYAFNPWGEEYIVQDQRTSRVLPDNAVWEYLRKKYRCSTVVVYTGKNFQKENSEGACVGLANDFGTYMYTHLMMMAGFPNQFPPIPGQDGAKTAVERMGTIVYSSEFNAFVERTISGYRGGFGINKGNVCPIALRAVFRQLRRSTVLVNPSEVDTFKVLSRAINKNLEIRTELLEIVRDEDQTRVQQARDRVRSILRATDGRLHEVNSNALNADIRRYLQSGNINISELRTNHVNNHEVDTFKVLNRSINKNVVLRKELLAILQNNDQTRVTRAQEYVRSILRAANSRLYETNNRRLNADIRRYLQSGNIRAMNLRNNTVRMNVN